MCYNSCVLGKIFLTQPKPLCLLSATLTNLIYLSLQVNLCVFLNNSLRKTNLSLFCRVFICSDWWPGDLQYLIPAFGVIFQWNFSKQEDHTIETTQLHFPLQIMPGQAFASPHPPVFLICCLFLAETCIKLNIEKVQCLKGLGEMPETAEIE